MMTIQSAFSSTNRDGACSASRIFSCATGRTLALLFLLSVFGAPTLRAQTYRDLFNFTAALCCPQYPEILAQGRDGNLYGTIETGGTNGVGIVFRITPTGTMKTIYSFDTVHGKTPVGGLVLGPDGNLYGTTEDGGAHGFGNIFKITPFGVLTVLYDFTGAADGGLTVAPLTLALDGLFHGISYPGVAFKISSAGVFSVVTKVPTVGYGQLLQTRSGVFYGTTQFGGTHSAGTIYKIAGNTSTILYNFDGPHGAYPIGGLVQGSDGNLYGTTTAGGPTNAGVIFRITPAGVFSVMLDFDSAHPLGGYQAFAGLIAGSDGNLYGATIWGGTAGYGVIFRMTTGGAYTVLHNFNALRGDGAYSTPMQHTNGQIFGMTERGGANLKGVIYSFDDALPAFIQLVSPAGAVGHKLGILGNGLAGTTGVTFNGSPASFSVVSDTYIAATIPSGETGFVTVTTSAGKFLSNKIFKVTPTFTGFTPSSGKVGDPITITGTGLIQTAAITAGGVAVQAYTVNSDSQLTFAVPPAAVTGNIVVTTPGGTATSATAFTVTQ
jgi:uncharacterized repeat protein (TIGR03803 family)